jgi:hypothetical protein
MKATGLLIVGLFASKAFAQAPAVLPELIGTWASAQIDCQRAGPSTLTVTASSVTRFNIRGSIMGTRIIGSRSVDVLFDPLSTGSHSLRYRKFVLSANGGEIHELDGDKVVAKRRRCAATGS